MANTNRTFSLFLGIIITIGQALTGVTTDTVDHAVVELPAGPVDIFSPAQDGTGRPVVVLLHGGGNKGNSEMLPMGEELARSGAVVFVPTYDSGQPRSREAVERTFEGAVCGTRFARSVAAEFSGDPNNVVVVGFSYGGLPGAAMAVTADYDFDCFAGTSHVPQAFVGLGGAYYYDWDIQGLWGDIDASQFTTSGNAGAGVGVPITLMHGVGDANVPIDHAERHFRILDAAGETVGLDVLDTRHAELVRPDDAAGQAAIATILAATFGEHESGQHGVSTVGASPWARMAAGR